MGRLEPGNLHISRRTLFRYFGAAASMWVGASLLGGNFAEAAQHGRLGHNKLGSSWSRSERIYTPTKEWDRILRATHHGRRCLLSWKPSQIGRTHSDVASGRADGALDSLKDSLRRNTNNKVFYIAYNHEPENRDHPINADVYRAASKRFARRVTQPLSNARFTLCLIREEYGIGDSVNPQSKWDIGPNYIDLYAGDPYNPWGLERGYEWRELEWLATPLVRYARRRGKPASVWETGCQNSLRKPQWIINAGHFAREVGLKHLTFFYGRGPRAFWNIESSDACVDAIRTLARMNYF